MTHRLIVSSLLLASSLVGSLEAEILFEWTTESQQVQDGNLKAKTGPNGKVIEEAIFDTEGLIEFAGKQHIEFPESAEMKIPAKGFAVEAEVRVDRPQTWGSVIACSQDNGSYERGWLLGHSGDRFCFKLSTGGSLISATANKPFSPGQWAKILGVFDGEKLRLYIDGNLAATQPAKGELARPEMPTPFVMGAYKDKDEFFPFHGRIRNVRVHDSPPSEQKLRKMKPRKFPFAVRPFVRFLDPETAEIQWESSEAGPALVVFGTTPKFGETIDSTSKGTLHKVTLQNLKPGTLYHYRLATRTAEGLVSGKVHTFDTTLNEIPPSLSDIIAPATDPKLKAYAAKAVETAGFHRGFCLVIGITDGSLLREIARISNLTVIGVETDAERILAVRQNLHAEGIYGRRISITRVSDFKTLPLSSCLANLVVSERGIAGEPLPTTMEEVERILRPRGFALISDGKNIVEKRRPKLDGSGDWCHQYADTANTANTGDTLSGANATSDYSLQWLGRPGANFGLDRNPRMPAPLAVNGRLFHQGMNRMVALDAYNGHVLWALEVPDLRRLNMPHDCGNWCADDDTLFLAVRDRVWALDAKNGELRTTYQLTSRERGTHDWGYLACTDSLILGSSVTAGAQFTDFWGSAMWFDKAGDPNATALVCSDNVFAYDKDSTNGLWAYGRGLIINSTITIKGDQMWFVESRIPPLERPEEGRIAGNKLWEFAHIVCLDTRTGKIRSDFPLPDPGIEVEIPKPEPPAPEPPAEGDPAMEEKEEGKEVTPPPPPVDPGPPETEIVPLIPKEKGYIQVAHGSHTGEGYLLVLSIGGTRKGGLYLYLHFDEKDGKLAWHQTTRWRSNNHGAHMAHPVVMKDRIYIEPGGVNLSDGSVLDHQFGPRVGCATVVGSDNNIFFRGLGGCLTQWSLDSHTPSAWSRVRPSCWINMLPSQGMMLIPEGGGGCSCGGWMETSMGLIPNKLLSNP